MELEAGEGVEVLSLGRYREIGQLAPRARSAELEWFVRAPDGGEVTVRAKSQKGGEAERRAGLS